MATPGLFTCPLDKEHTSLGGAYIRKAIEDTK